MTLLESLIILIAGLMFGSFVTCASYRMPLEKEWVRTPSFCPKCSAKLTFKDLWPVLSWLFSGAKCRHCSAPIPARYPFIELLTAASFLAIYASHGITFGSILLMLMSVVLLIMIVADLEHTIIPDQVHIALLPLGLGFHAYLGTDWGMVLGGFFAMTSLALFLHYGYAKLRGMEVLGFGDVKFFAVAGVWLTLPLTVPYIFMIGVVGTVMGLVWKYLYKQPIFPFGPSLAVSLWICMVYPQIPNLFWDIINNIKYT